MLLVHLLRPSECFSTSSSGDSLGPHDSLNSLLELVDERTKQDVRKYRFLRDARRCLLGRLLARYVLISRLGTPWAEVEFGKSERGRPFALSKFTSSPLPIDYNVSHDSDVVAVASLPFPSAEAESPRVGLDVMRLRNPWEGCSVDEFVEGIGEQLGPSERKALASSPSDSSKLRHVLALWTLKEAYIKATGDGLHFDLLCLSFQIDLSTTSSSSSSPSQIGSASLDGAPLRGWHFDLVELLGKKKEEKEEEEERYFLAVAQHDPSSGEGKGVVAYYSTAPGWVRGMELEEVVTAANKEGAAERTEEEEGKGRRCE